MRRVIQLKVFVAKTDINSRYGKRTGRFGQMFWSCFGTGTTSGRCKWTFNHPSIGKHRNEQWPLPNCLFSWLPAASNRIKRSSKNHAKRIWWPKLTKKLRNYWLTHSRPLFRIIGKWTVNKHICDHPLLHFPNVIPIFVAVSLAKRLPAKAPKPCWATAQHG